MRIYNVPWINHEGGAIFSIDIHVLGKKIATAGQDQAGAGLLIVWSIEFIFEKDNAKDSEEKRGILARIPHAKSINCVRWSKDGKRLVCAGDDPMITVYECVGGITSLGTIGDRSNVKSKNAENYRCIHFLQGHIMDVMHVDWSPDGKYLASCSIDNSIIIWNAKSLPEKVIILKDSNNCHRRGIKGLAWDPMGRFLSTQAEDNSLKLWQTDNWECVRTITEPFQESIGSTLFLRMDWSPDGSYLVCPSAMNNGGPTANIVTRKDWNHQRDLVGFRKAVSCVRANPRCFYRKNSSGQRVTVSCFATGSRDRSLAIWLVPNFGRPLMVYEKMFKFSVLDLSWNSLTLAACSNDGTVVLFNFDELEIGEMYSSTEMASLSEKIYGFLPDVYKNARNVALQSNSSSDFIFSLWLNKRKRKVNNDFRHIFTIAEVKIAAARAKRQRMQQSSDDDQHSKINSKKEKDVLAKVDSPFEQRDLTFLKRASTTNYSNNFFEMPRQRRLLTANWRSNYVTEVSNASTPDESTSQIICYRDKRKLWTSLTDHSVSHLAMNWRWVCVYTFSGRCLIYSTKTGRLLHSIIFGYPSVCAEICRNFCVFILSNGELVRWNLETNKLHRCRTNEMLENQAHQLTLSVENGGGIRAFTNDRSTFKLGNLGCWSNMGSICTFALNSNLLKSFISFVVPKAIAADWNEFRKMIPNSNKLAGNFESVTKIDDSGVMEVILKKAITQYTSKCHLRFLVSIFAQRTKDYKKIEQFLAELSDNDQLKRSKEMKEICTLLKTFVHFENFQENM